MKILPLYCFKVTVISSIIVFYPTTETINLLRKKYERPGIRIYPGGKYTRHIHSLSLKGGDILVRFTRISIAETETDASGKIKITVIETHALIPEIAIPYYQRSPADIDLILNNNRRIYDKYLSLFEQICKEALLEHLPEADPNDDAEKAQDIRKKRRQIERLSDKDLIELLMKHSRIPDDWRLTTAEALFESSCDKLADAKGSAGIIRHITSSEYQVRLLRNRNKFAGCHEKFTDSETAYLLRAAVTAPPQKESVKIMAPGEAQMTEDNFSEYMLALPKNKSGNNAEDGADAITEDDLQNPLTEESLKKTRAGNAVRKEVIPGFTEEDIQKDADICGAPVLSNDYWLKIMSEGGPVPEPRPEKTAIITGLPASRFPEELFVAGHYPEEMLRCLIPASEDGSCFYAPGCYLRILENDLPACRTACRHPPPSYSRILI